MGKHIHIWVHDAGFDESKHPRDGGKFTSNGGNHGAAPANKIDDANHGKVDKNGRRMLSSNHAEHPNEAARLADVQERHQQMLAAGFQHKGNRTVGEGNMATHHQDYVHTDGRKGMISHSGMLGRHTVSATTSYK